MKARPNYRVIRPNSHPNWQDAEQVLETRARLPQDVVRSYPSVPFHKLPELHAILQEGVRRGTAPPYHVTRGYAQVWRELLGERPGG